MKCEKCGAPVGYRRHHPIGLGARYDSLAVDDLAADNKRTAARLKAADIVIGILAERIERDAATIEKMAAENVDLKKILTTEDTEDHREKKETES